MTSKISNRQFLSAAIIVFYLIPLLFFSAYSIKLMSQSKSWALLSLGLLLVFFGSLSLIFLLSYWEKSLRDKKESPPFLVSQSSDVISEIKKETKVTQLDPSLKFESIVPHDPPIESAIHKENSKEFNLLQAALLESQNQQEELMKNLELKDLEIRKQEYENKQLQMKIQQIAQDFSDYKLFSEEQRKQKQLQLTSMQQMVEDQRGEMEKRQEQIHQLDTKVHDLSYEIKTLLCLHEEETNPKKNLLAPSKKEKLQPISSKEQKENGNEEYSSSSIAPAPLSLDKSLQDHAIQTPTEAAHLLKKCIQIAQKLTGANYYTNESSRYREFTSSHFSIDQRRLFDSLRHEKSALVVIYLQKDHKLIFANNESKKLLGWSPEKFLSDFPSIMHEGIQEWKKALQMLVTNPESQARLLAKTKQGHEIFLNCHLGIIPSGLFRNYIIGVLYPPS